MTFQGSTKCAECGEFVSCDPARGVHVCQKTIASDDTVKGPAEDEIRAVCNELAELLVGKNRAYGDALLSPVKLFSKQSPVERILSRMDDKVSRLARGHNAGEDVEIDLLGYLVFLRIARRREAAGR